MIKNKQGKQIIIWISALIAGAILGCLGISFLNRVFNFVAEVFTRLFQFIAVPTIALAVITTLSELGAKKNTGKIFAHTIHSFNHFLCSFNQPYFVYYFYA